MKRVHERRKIPSSQKGRLRINPKVTEIIESFSLLGTPVRGYPGSKLSKVKVTLSNLNCSNISMKESLCANDLWVNLRTKVSQSWEKMEKNPMISMLNKDPTFESLDSTSGENQRKSSNSLKTHSIKIDDIKPSPKRWLIVTLFFIFSANTAFQVK